MAINFVTETNKCCGCAVCDSVCPIHAISMSYNNEGFLYPTIDQAKCVECHLCQKSCPINVCPAVFEVHKTFIQKVYACVNNNGKILCESSSGGVFYELASNVIKCGGVVFGASFSEEGMVEHTVSEDIGGLSKFMGSKYVQSDTRMIWPKVKEYLSSGRKVLFSGTPCEIGALRSYLKKDYDNLILVDVLCMGTPSPMVWKSWKEELEDRYNSKAKNINFRSKKYGGAFSHSLMITFENGKEYWNPMYADPYVKGFYNRLFLRSSCHHCSYKKLHRESDITLGDFWGAKDVGIDLQVDNGLSIVIVQSPKGESAFNQIKKNFSYKETTIDTAAKIQPMMTMSCLPNIHREDFFRDFCGSPHESLSFIVGHYLPITMKDIIRAKLKRVRFVRGIVRLLKNN